MTYLLNASEPPDVFVSGYDCPDDCGVRVLEELVVDHLKGPNHRPYV